MHAGCPVLSNQTKWAANVWVWNPPGQPGHSNLKTSALDEGTESRQHDTLPSDDLTVSKQA